MAAGGESEAKTVMTQEEEGREEGARARGWEGEGEGKKEKEREENSPCGLRFEEKSCVTNG